jgi:hypothetical protein
MKDQIPTEVRSKDGCVEKGIGGTSMPPSLRDQDNSFIRCGPGFPISFWASSWLVAFFSPPLKLISAKKSSALKRPDKLVCPGRFRKS